MNSLRVLLIEDSETDAALLRTHLERAFSGDVTVDRVETLAAAVSRLLAAPGAFDVVLLDLTLPDSSGVGTLSTLRPYAGGLPVVVLSGDDSAQHLVRLGASEFVSKGDYAEVVSVLIRVVQRSRQGFADLAANSVRWQTLVAGIADITRAGSTQAEVLDELREQLAAVRAELHGVAGAVGGRDGLESRLESLEVWRGRWVVAGYWVVRVLVGAALAGLVARLVGGGPVDVP